MKINKKKGAVIASVLVLMIIVIAISTLILTLTMGASISNKYETTKLKKQVLTNKIFDDFVDNQTIDENYSEYDLTVQVYVNDENTNQKAVVAKKTNAEKTILYFYCIYDFTLGQEKVLAKQSQDFYLTKKVVNENDNEVEYYYLADMIKYVEV